MKTFEYLVPATAEDATRALAADPSARVLAGGTNLVDLMKLGVVEPATLVDVTALPLDEVTTIENGGLRIGANVRNSDLAAHPLIRSRYPVLSQALLSGANGQLRNMATTGGNLFQRTRCSYFMDVDKACNKRDPGSGCSARTGANRGMAILGASASCVATHPSDMATALAVLDPELEVLGPGGRRTVPFADLYRLPGDDPRADTTIARDDLVLAVTIPEWPAARSSMYRKVRDRSSFAFAVISVAAVLTVTDGEIDDVRIALGSVAHKPWRATLVEDALRGQVPSRRAFEVAVDRELEAAEPLSDNAFKIDLVRSVVTQTLVQLTGEGHRS